MTALVACGSCRRHARASVCPFCGARIAGAPVPKMERRPTSRRHVLLFATTLGIAGCGDRTGLQAPPADGAADSEQLDDAVADSESVLDTEFDADIPIIDTSLPDDDGGGVPIYGAAPFQ